MVDGLLFSTGMADTQGDEVASPDMSAFLGPSCGPGMQLPPWLVPGPSPLQQNDLPGVSVAHPGDPEPHVQQPGISGVSVALPGMTWGPRPPPGNSVGAFAAPFPAGEQAQSNKGIYDWACRIFIHQHSDTKVA